jgi:hypothetical protein
MARVRFLKLLADRARDFEKHCNFALNMLRKDMPLETIAELTGLTIAQLKKLQAKNPA